MSSGQSDSIWVWLDDPSFGPLQRIGTLSHGERGSVRFAYDATWLKQDHCFHLDLELDLTAGESYPTQSNFGVFMSRTSRENFTSSRPIPPEEICAILPPNEYFSSNKGVYVSFW